MRIHGALIHLHTRTLATQHGPFDLHVFRNLGTRALTLVAARGDLSWPEALLARVHSSCVTSEALHAVDCDCAGQLDAALRAISEEGRGALFYLMQEGRGAGLAAKARDRMLVQASGHTLTTFEAYEQLGLGRDQRRYADVASAAHLLGIRGPLRLLTNNPEKREALEREKIAVSRLEGLERRACRYSAHYLEAKRLEGHRLARPEEGRAELPEPVEAFEPRPLTEGHRFVEIASYLLPVREPTPSSGLGAHGEALERRTRWLRLRLVNEASGNHEFVLLEPAATAGGARVRAAGPLAVTIACEWLPDRLGPRSDRAVGIDEIESWLRCADASAGGLAVFAPAPVGLLGTAAQHAEALGEQAAALLADVLGERGQACELRLAPGARKYSAGARAGLRRGLEARGYRFEVADPGVRQRNVSGGGRA